MSVVYVRVAVVVTIPKEAPRLVATHLRPSRPYRAPPSRSSSLSVLGGGVAAAVLPCQRPSLRSIRWAADQRTSSTCCQLTVTSQSLSRSQTLRVRSDSLAHNLGRVSSATSRNRRIPKSESHPYLSGVSAKEPGWAKPAGRISTTLAPSRMKTAFARPAPCAPTNRSVSWSADSAALNGTSGGKRRREHERARWLQRDRSVSTSVMARDANARPDAPPPLPPLLPPPSLVPLDGRCLTARSTIETTMRGMVCDEMGGKVVHAADTTLCSATQCRRLLRRLAAGDAVGSHAPAHAPPCD